MEKPPRGLRIPRPGELARRCPIARRKIINARWTAAFGAICLLTFVAFLFLLPIPALANGGTVQVAGERAGPYRLTVLTSPSPIRVGMVDVSVLVQKADSDDLVQDALVLVTATPIGFQGPEEIFKATHDLATNKLYYAAHVELPSEGRWGIQVEAVGEMGEGLVSFEVEASQVGLLDNPLLLMTLLLLPVLAVGGWWALRRGKGAAAGGPQR